MGAWGTGPFDSDAALEFVDEIGLPEFSFDGIQWAFEDPDYLDFDGGTIAIVLGALIRSAQGETELPDLDLDLERFAQQITPERVAWVRAQIARALAGSDASELYDLWDASGELDAWLEASRAAMPSQP